MSNATEHSRQSGQSRRRRSRGGKNRNRNNQNNRRDGDRGSQSNRSEEFRPKGPRPPRGAPPVKLKWWQKLLQAVGLYKAPAPPARGQRKTDVAKSGKGEAKAPKSNTRIARSDNSSTERAEVKTPKRDRRGSRGGDPSTVESPRVYVGNLSYDVTEQDLQELFKGIGSVRNVEIVYNRSTHRSKGYGFVEMLHKDDAIRSVEVLNDQPFMGRKMTVSGAKSKGLDEREEEDQRTDSEPAKVALAPLPETPDEPVAGVADADEPVAEAEASAEPEIQTIVETPAESSSSEAPPAAESTEDLVAKYGFDESEEKSQEG